MIKQNPMIGRTISHYKITEKLGEGGMGVVYKAEDTKLDRPVALKFLAAHAIEDPEHKARFVREAKAAARLDHQNICSVYEIDEAEGQTFLAMAYLEGHTVKDKVAERPLKLDQVLDIAVQTAQGLQAAHEKDIVHRDIKSANLMVTPQGTVKVMDFGLAQLADRSKLTETTTILGTPSYMSPEQAAGAKTDRRTDLWSLRVVLYEMVTGRLPFEGERQEAVLYGITHDEPEPVTAQRAGLPMELEWIVGKCLAKAADERYQHAEDLLVDFRSLQKKLAAGESAIIRTSPGTDVRASAADAGARHAVPAGAATSDEERARHGVPLHSEGEGIEQALAPYRVIERLSDEGDTVTYRAEDTQLHRSVSIRVVPDSAAQKAKRRQALRAAALLALGAIVMGLGGYATNWFGGQDSPDSVHPRKFAFSHEGLNLPTISPNGRHIAFTVGFMGAYALWVQDLDQEEPRELIPPG